MKHTWILFSILIAMWLVVGAAFFVPQSKNTRGIQPEKTDKFPAMAKGGSGEKRHGQLLWIGWSFGALAHLFFAGLLVFGIRRRNQLNPLTVPLLFGVVLEIGVLIAIFLTYRQYMSASGPMLLGPFPAPTTIMIVGVWAMPFYYVVLYVVFFSRYIWTPEDEAAFEQLLAEKNVAEPQA